MIAALVAMVVGVQTTPAEDPAFTLAKTMLGGTWHGIVGKDMKIQFKFSLHEGGKMIVGDGVLGVGSKHPITMRSALGWDPAAKQIYYLDQHGYDTVYYGHVTRVGSDLVFDFNALSGDTGHYRTTQHFEPNHYTATMDYEKDGKWISMGFHHEMSRG